MKFWQSLVWLLGVMVPFLSAAEGARVIAFHGFNDCIELTNSKARVILCPAVGGRVLEYSIGGKNALWLDSTRAGDRRDGSAGRFDIGPERILPRREALFRGPYRGEITGARAARLTSGKDASTGFQIVREFVLAKDTAHLVCRQTVINISRETRQVCYWGRGFAQGQGICIVPLSGVSRMPKEYVLYKDHLLIDFAPDDPAITRQGNYLVIDRPPSKPKLGFDSMAGWMAYLSRNDLLFVKRWPTFPDRVYGEMASLTLSIWYPSERPMCELEPIGPREILKPGERATFTEEWFLASRKYPKISAELDVSTVARQSHELMKGNR